MIWGRNLFPQNLEEMQITRFLIGALFCCLNFGIKFADTTEKTTTAQQASWLGFFFLTFPFIMKAQIRYEATPSTISKQCLVHMWIFGSFLESQKESHSPLYFFSRINVLNYSLKTNIHILACAANRNNNKKHQTKTKGQERPAPTYPLLHPCQRFKNLFFWRYLFKKSDYWHVCKFQEISN